MISPTCIKILPGPPCKKAPDNFDGYWKIIFIVSFSYFFQGGGYNHSISRCISI